MILTHSINWPKILMGQWDILIPYHWALKSVLSVLPINYQSSCLTYYLQSSPNFPRLLFIIHNFKVLLFFLRCRSYGRKLMPTGKGPAELIFLSSTWIKSCRTTTGCGSLPVAPLPHPPLNLRPAEALVAPLSLRLWTWPGEQSSTIKICPI